MRKLIFLFLLWSGSLYSQSAGTSSLLSVNEGLSQGMVFDPIAPTMLCKNVTVNLDASGNATITPAQVNNGSSDNCSIASLTLSQTVFGCANVGANTVTLTGKDPSGNTAGCQATVTVKDLIAPTAKCKNATVQLGANGSVTVPAASINNNSTDNCSISFSVTPAVLNCANVGANTVTLKATDAGGNTATCTAVVTVQDKSAPNALCKNINVYLDDNGHASITASQVDNGSTDNCGIASRSIDRSQFDCGQIGNSPVSVVLSLKDNYNNQSSCIAYVTVKDAIQPTAVCNDITVHLNSQGQVTVYGADLADNSTDNCSVWSYSPIAKVYTTANLGVNNLNITVKDFSNNAAVCLSHVTVLAYGFGQRSQAVDPATTLDKLEMNVYPNPADRNLTLDFQLPEDQPMHLRLIDASGRQALGMNLSGLKGENNWSLDLSQLAPGLYLLDLRSESLFGQQRVVVQR